MTRIRQNLRERAIGMLKAGMTMNAVAMNIGCSIRAIRHLRQRALHCDNLDRIASE